MATAKRNKKPAPAAPPEAEASNVLFLRNMPPDVMTGLSEWVEEIKAASLGGANITRTDLARDILTRLARGQAVEPRKVAASKK